MYLLSELEAKVVLLVGGVGVQGPGAPGRGHGHGRGAAPRNEIADPDHNPVGYGLLGSSRSGKNGPGSAKLI